MFVSFVQNDLDIEKKEKQENAMKYEYYEQQISKLVENNENKIFVKENDKFVEAVMSEQQKEIVEKIMREFNVEESKDSIDYFFENEKIYFRVTSKENGKVNYYESLENSDSFKLSKKKDYPVY